MTTRKLVMWEKYEDILENQVHSPLAERILPKRELPEHDDGDEWKRRDKRNFYAISDSLAHEVQLTTNFDCWIGHTSFNVTKPIKKILNKVEGVEALRICTRYRFFVGIGRMFNSENVRNNIDLKLKEYLDGKSKSKSRTSQSQPRGTPTERRDSQDNPKGGEQIHKSA